MKKELEVVAAVIQKDNKYFCAKRKDSGELARKWEFPGGKVEVGETHEATIIREIKEELKTNIKVIDYITTVKHEYQSFKIILHAYLCEVVNGNLILTEHLNSKWLTSNEMEAFDFANADKPIIKAIKNLEIIWFNNKGGNMIQIENMSMIYPNGKGVFDINLNVKAGEVFGFLGPNGAGKTTTIRQLMGFTNATKGRCFINGLDTRKETEVIQRDLGYLPGEIAFFDNMTGNEFLEFLTSLRGHGTDRRKSELLKLFELDSDSPINKMSKGMKQKLGLVAAFMHDPDILILDEPTSGLDPLMQRKFINLIKEEKERGKTILLSSHMFEEVDRTCSRAAIIKEGRIVVTEDITTLKKNLKKSFLVTLGKKEDINIIAASGLEYNIIESLKLEIFVSAQYKEFFYTLNQCDVTSLDIVEQSLEQVFIGYYGKEEE